MRKNARSGRAMLTGCLSAPPGESLSALRRRARTRRKRAGYEAPPRQEVPQLVRLASRTEACHSREQGQHGDQPAERGPERLGAGEVGRRRCYQKRGADHVREPRRPRILERPFPENRLEELEVHEARQAVPASESQPDDELEGEQREQPPPAGEDR